MDLLTTSHLDRPKLDMTLTGTLLEAVAQGRTPDTIRVFRPGPTLAFGRLDRARPGFGEACRVASAHGRTPVVRWGGGHAAAYDSECLIVEVLRRHDRSAISGLEDRFRDMVDLVRRALARFGVNLELGELPREYCPGRYSLHLPSGPKVAGVAQRVLTRASLTTAVVVVGGANTLRSALGDVYAALDLPLDIRTAGAVTDQHPEVDCDLVRQSVIDGAAARYQIVLPRWSNSATATTANSSSYEGMGIQVDEHV
jgi:octanoyl-[GcvH]:protein N-octanoyltransferase